MPQWSQEEVRRFYKTRDWAAARKIVLERDEYICQIRGHKCTVEANEADHIKPIADFPDLRLDLDNLRASCKSCNSSRSTHQKNQSGWKRSNTMIILVSGSTKLIPKKHLETGDIVISRAQIRRFLRKKGEIPSIEHDVVAGMIWEDFIRRLRRGEVDAGRVWLCISKNEDPDDYPHHQIGTVSEERSGSVQVDSNFGGRVFDPSKWL